jgi:hypothetical protein
LGERGSAVGQTGAAPDLLARFDAGVYGDPPFSSWWSADGGLDQAHVVGVQQVFRDQLGCFGGQAFHHLLTTFLESSRLPLPVSLILPLGSAAG